MTRPAYSVGAGKGRAASRSNGPSTVDAGAAQTAPTSAWARRCSATSSGMQLNSSSGWPSTTRDLRHFEPPEAGGPAERWLDGPREQIGASGVTDDAPVERVTGGHAGGDEHVPAVAFGVGQHPWVTPHLVVGAGVVECLVPAGVGLEHLVAGRLPHDEIGGGRLTDALDAAVRRRGPARCRRDASGRRGRARLTRSTWRDRPRPARRSGRGRRATASSRGGRARRRVRCWLADDVGAGRAAPARPAGRRRGSGSRRGCTSCPTPSGRVGEASDGVSP